jgi:hypothetical protein
LLTRRTLLFCRLVVNFMEFGVFDLRNRLAQAITEIGAMLLGLVIGSVTTLFHHCNQDRRYFIGGSDARIIVGDDEGALIRLWREKRGEIEPQDLSSNLLVQLGLATEELNRRWYEANTGQVVIDIQKRVRHPALRWM